MTTVKPFKKVNNIALIGRTGTGKSSTANTLYGLDHFKSGRSSATVTDTYESHEVNCEEFTSPICIIDTPGLTGSPEDKRVFYSELKKAIESCESGFQAILVVESLLEKYSTTVEDSFRFMSAVLKCNLEKYGILVFTHADMVQNPSEYIMNDKNLSEIVAKLDNRYVVISNRNKNPNERHKQRSQLCLLIQKLIENNESTGFTQRCLMTTEEFNSLVDVTDAESRLKTEKEAEHDINIRQMSEQYEQELHEMQKTKTQLQTAKDVSHTEQYEQKHHETQKTKTQLQTPKDVLPTEQCEQKHHETQKTKTQLQTPKDMLPTEQCEQKHHETQKTKTKLQTPKDVLPTEQCEQKHHETQKTKTQLQTPKDVLPTEQCEQKHHETQKTKMQLQTPKDVLPTEQCEQKHHETQKTKTQLQTPKDVLPTEQCEKKHHETQKTKTQLQTPKDVLPTEQCKQKHHGTQKTKTQLQTPKDVLPTGNAVAVKIGSTVSEDYQNGIFDVVCKTRPGDYVYQDEGKIGDPWKNLSIHDLQKHKKDQELKLVLVGMAGGGKTSTGNMILGQEDLQANKESKSNKMIISRRTIVNDRNVLVIDTPGLSENQNHKRNTHVRKEILQLVEPEIPSFVIVLSTDIPFSMETEKCIKNFLEPFVENFEKYAVVVFTGADHLKANESSLSKHLDDNSLLESFLELFGKRMVPFNNNDPSNLEKESQRQHLMSIVIQMNESRKTYIMYQQYKQIEQKLQKKKKNKKGTGIKGLKQRSRSVGQVLLHDDKNQIEPSDKKSDEVGEENRQDQSIEKIGPGKCTVM